MAIKIANMITTDSDVAKGVLGVQSSRPFFINVLN